MVIDIALIVLGLVLLVGGGEALVRGGSGIALAARLSPAVVGLTVVAIGTSLPELFVSVRAALAGSADIALGNVMGSNIFNIGAVLGVAALIRVLPVQRASLFLEWPFLIGSSVLAFGLLQDGVVGRADGGILFAGFVAFIGLSLWNARRAQTQPDDDASSNDASNDVRARPAWVRSVVLVVVGIALLVGGAEALVSGAVSVAKGWGLSEAVIGLTVVAAGTSLPEFATSVVAALRGETEMAITNVIGSNVFNVCGILGATAALAPITASDEMAGRDMFWVMGLGLLLFALMWTGRRISRIEGLLLLATYLIYTGRLVASAI